jgi:hypothetical protein
MSNPNGILIYINQDLCSIIQYYTGTLSLEKITTFSPLTLDRHIKLAIAVQHIRRIFLSNYWWQKSDVWSQASYRYPILWEAFLDPSDSYFLFAVERGYHRVHLECDEKCAYMFNVYKNQLSRQTGSRNMTGPKTLPTIWYTYMMLVTKYQISAINSY